jgi:hypothetical protein
MEKTIDEIITHYENKTQEITKKSSRKNTRNEKLCIKMKIFYFTKLKKEYFMRKYKRRKRKNNRTHSKRICSRSLLRRFTKNVISGLPLKKQVLHNFKSRKRPKNYWKAKARTLILISFISTIVPFFPYR